MSVVWGEVSSCKINSITLEHSIVEPTFLQSAEIMHESCLNHKRTYSNKHDYFEVMITVYLFKYANPTAKALSLLALEDTIVAFEFSSTGELNMNMYLELVDIKPLQYPWRDDIAILILKSTDFIGDVTGRLSTKASKFIKTKAGKFIKPKGIL